MSKRRIIHSKERKVVYKALRFFEEEAAAGKLSIPIQQSQKRAAAATGVSLTTIKRIKREASVSPNLTAPGKRKRPQKNRHVLSMIDDFNLCLIRQTANEFYANNVTPSLTTLLAAVKEKINFPWKNEMLRRIMHRIGFRWKRCGDQRMVLMERQDIVQWRYRFLREIKKYRDSERLIIYLDETWIDDNLCFGKCWQLKKYEALQKKTAGTRLLLVHAASQDGLIQGASLSLTLQSDDAKGSKENANQEQMNFNTFSKWLKEILLPNIPDNSVICMDDAPYHNKVLRSVPSKYATKNEISEWLGNRQIPHSLEMRKTELYDLVAANSSLATKYSVDDILKASGHDVLRIPPYHCDLSIFEMAWSSTKRFVQDSNVNAEFKLTTVKVLTSVALSSITKVQWNKYYDQVITVENKYWQLDALVEQALEEISFMVGVEFSSEDDFTDDDDSKDENSDSDLSSVET